MIKVLYVGSKNMGYKGLQVLLENQNNGFLRIVGVIAREDDNEEHWYKSVSELARQHGLKLFIPPNINDEKFTKKIGALEPDWGLCCFYHKLFKKNFFSIPHKGFLNLHFAPLPRYRGALPIPYAIINDEKIHGVTLHFIEAGMDSGNIVSQELFPIFETDTGLDLYKRCEDFGEKLLKNKLKNILFSNNVFSFKQDENRVIKHYRSDLKEKRVGLEKGMKYFYNFVRAFDFPPFELSFIEINGKCFYLSLKPKIHGFNVNYNYINYKDYKIYLIPKEKK